MTTEELLTELVASQEDRDRLRRSIERDLAKRVVMTMAPLVYRQSVFLYGDMAGFEMSDPHAIMRLFVEDLGIATAEDCDAWAEEGEKK